MSLDITLTAIRPTEVYSRNITHNLNDMAEEAGIYKHVWRPEEIGITHARDLIEPLTTALELMYTDPDRFKKHNPDNGWGSYEGFVAFVESYLASCAIHPDALIEVNR